MAANVLSSCQCSATRSENAVASRPPRRARGVEGVFCHQPRSLFVARNTVSVSSRCSQEFAASTSATPPPRFHTIQEAVDDIRDGKFVVVLDDEDRENEGDLILAAEKATAESVSWMREHTSGYICVAMTGQNLDRLELPAMVDSRANNESMCTAFTITVDLLKGTTTGISAADRAATLQALADPASEPQDFRRPGHINPLRYREGGVVVRPGHTEAAVDLAVLAGCQPAGVLCEIVNTADPQGSMARTPDLLTFAERYGLKCVTIKDLVIHRSRTEVFVQRIGSCELHTRAGRLRIATYRSLVDDGVFYTATPCSIQTSQPQSTRLYVHRLAGLLDILGASSDAQSNVLDSVLAEMAQQQQGLVILLPQVTKLALNSHQPLESSVGVTDLELAACANMLRDHSMQCVELDARSVCTAQQLQALGFTALRTEQPPPVAVPAASAVPLCHSNGVTV